MVAVRFFVLFIPGFLSPGALVCMLCSFLYCFLSRSFSALSFLVRVRVERLVYVNAMNARVPVNKNPAIPAGNPGLVISPGLRSSLPLLFFSFFLAQCLTFVTRVNVENKKSSRVNSFAMRLGVTRLHARKTDASLGFFFKQNVPL